MTLQQFIDQVRDLTTQREVVEYAYNFLSSKYYGDRIKWFTYIQYLWEHIDFDQMWIKDGPVQCMHINRLLKHVLVESGHFTEENISLLRTFPHQYVKIKYADGTRIFVDIRAKNYGIPFGDYARAFGNKEK